MEKSPSSAESGNTATYDSAFEDKNFIICRKVDFHHGISTLLHNAWKHRNSESHLYALLSYIQTIQSLTLLHKTPTKVVAPWPQPLFGTLGAPQGAKGYPVRNATLPGNYYPDHARIIIFGGRDQGPSYSLQAPISIALDSSEAKVLNVETSWELEVSKRAAAKVAQSHLDQVCDSSLAGLAHNPFWPSLYAFLIIGPYFSLFAWKTRPDPALLELIPAAPIVPKDAKNKAELMENRRQVIKQRIARIERTPLPEVIYYNEPIFDFGVKPSLKWYEQATLSRNYLDAVSLPTSTLSEELECQPSWFEVDDPSGFIGRQNLRGLQFQQSTGSGYLRDQVITVAIKKEQTSLELCSDKSDLTLAGPKPPDSSDSQQSNFSDAEPQVIDINAGPHPMRMRAASRQGDAQRGVEDIVGASLDRVLH